MKKTLALMGASALIVALGPISAFGAEPSGPMQKYLTELKLSPSILDGLDKELALPSGLLEKAEKEGTVRITGSWNRKEFSKLNAPFEARYPKIKVKYSYARAYNARAIKPLIAFKEGQYITDIVTGFGGSRTLYRKEHALANLKGLPSFGQQVGGNDPHGEWAAIRLRFWCMAYNTNLVKPADLPKTWEDIITNPRWHGRKIGVANRPQLWLLMLWSAKGKPWVEDYISKFFSQVKPQLRKEGLTAMISLVVAGEFQAAIPAAPARVKSYQEKGAPVGWHCPEPVPHAVSRVAVFKGSPHEAAAKVWANWLLSREGQIAQAAAEGTPPSHKDLQLPELIPFSDKVLGRKAAWEDLDNLKELESMWDKHWKKTGR